jgi:hypothetical protein
MIKTMLALILSISAATVYAGCTTTTLIMGDGMPKICTTCCDANNNCNVICI